MGNFSFKTTGLPEPVNGVVEGHNFLQGVPHTEIYAGQNGLTFRNCNLLNCDIPAGSVTDNCLYPVYNSFCSHLHGEWFAKGYVPECVAECEHMTHKDIITIDGVAVDTSYFYEDKAVT
jgi:hypothetical protein